MIFHAARAEMRKTFPFRARKGEGGGLFDFPMKHIRKIDK